VACASPAYLAKHGNPREPADLAHHRCLGYRYDQSRDEWQFDNATGPASVRVHAGLQANNGDALRVAALYGVGVAMLPSFIVGPDLAGGQLVAILPGYTVPELAIHALYPHSRHLSAKVRSFVDFLVPRFGERPAWDAWMAGS